MRERAGLTKEDEREIHEETLPAAMRRDAEHAVALVSHLRERMTNPFDVSTHPNVLINISIGMHATSEVQGSL